MNISRKVLGSEIFEKEIFEKEDLAKFFSKAKEEAPLVYEAYLKADPFAYGPRPDYLIGKT